MGHLVSQLAAEFSDSEVSTQRNSDNIFLRDIQVIYIL